MTAGFCNSRLFACKSQQVDQRNLNEMIDRTGRRVAQQVEVRMLNRNSQIRWTQCVNL